jgi:TP901 family phage tail tape measure protein
MANRTVAVNFTANTAQYTAGVGKAALATGSLQGAALGVTKALIGPGALIFGLTQAVKWANATEEAHRNFTSEMLKLQTQIGLTTEDTQAMSQAVLSLAGATTKAPQELAEAMFFVASAGLRGKEALDVLRSSARLSAVGLGETKVIADLLTSAVNAYGSETLSAARASDDLVSAVRLGKLEADQLAGAMGRVLPIASAMGVTFNEVSGIMAAMSKTGTDAATATTQIRAIMVSLLKPSEQANQAMVELGMTQQGIRDIIMEDGLFEALLVLNEAVDGNTSVFAELFPNVRALAGVMDLLGPQLEGNIQLMRDHAAATGVASEAFAIFAESAQSQVERLAAEQERLAILQGQYQTTFRAAFREDRIRRTQRRADRIAFENDFEAMTGILLDGMVPALDAFRTANFQSNEEFQRALRESPMVRQAFDLLGGSINTLDRNTTGLLTPLDYFTKAAVINRNATLEQVESVLELVDALLLQRESIPTDAMNDYSNLLPDVTGAQGDLADALGFTNEELLDQIGLLRGKLDVQLRLLDPVYNAIKAERDYAEATAEVNRLQAEGNTASEEYVDALFEQEFAFLRMIGALEESDTVMPRFIEHLNKMIEDQRISAEAAQVIIDRINEQGRVMLELDGTTVRTFHEHLQTINVELNLPKLPDGLSWGSGGLPFIPNSSMSMPTLPQPNIPARARGGPVSAGMPYLVGEEGPELIIPRGAGTVLPAGQTAGVLSGSTYNVQVHMPPGADGNQVVEALRRWERSNGPVPIGVR